MDDINEIENEIRDADTPIRECLLPPSNRNDFVSEDEENMYDEELIEAIHASIQSFEDYYKENVNQSSFETKLEKCAKNITPPSPPIETNLQFLEERKKRMNDFCRRFAFADIPKDIRSEIQNSVQRYCSGNTSSISLTEIQSEIVNVWLLDSKNHRFPSEYITYILDEIYVTE